MYSQESDTANSETKINIEDKSNETFNENTPGENDCLQWRDSERLDSCSALKNCFNVLKLNTRTKWFIYVTRVVLVLVCSIAVSFVIVWYIQQTGVSTPTGQPEYSNKSTNAPQISVTNKPPEIFEFQNKMESIHLKMRNNNLGLSYSQDGLQPALVFRDAGVYNITLKVVYDQEYCGSDHPSGEVHLRMERAEDGSTVSKDFIEPFRRQENRSWVVVCMKSTKIKMKQGNGLRINTDYKDCIIADKSYLRVEKLSR